MPVPYQHQFSYPGPLHTAEVGEQKNEKKTVQD